MKIEDIEKLKEKCKEELKVLEKDTEHPLKGFTQKECILILHYMSRKQNEEIKHLKRLVSLILWFLVIVNIEILLLSIYVK